MGADTENHAPLAPPRLRSYTHPVRSLTEQARHVASGEVSASELVSDALASIERIQPALNAFTVVLHDDALRRARELEGAEGPPGPLHGVPVAVKDLYDVAGLPTTGCCAAYHDRVATTDAATVERLRGAGAVIVAKTNQHELALGTTTQLSSFGPAANPWDPARMPGGSSGGSGAAIAAGAVSMALGSDTGGSIRIPASFCGTTGLKPTHGAVSLRGVMPLAPSMDTVGPLARTAEDCLAVYRVLRGFDPDDLWSVRTEPRPAPERLRGLRLAVPDSFFGLLDREVADATHTAARVFEGMGIPVHTVHGPDPQGTRDRFAPMLIAEAAHHFRDLSEDDRVLEPTARLLSLGRAMTASDYVAAREASLLLSREFSASLSGADALLAPCTPFPAPLRQARDVPLDGGSLNVHTGGPTLLTLLVNAAGLPSLAFPVGFTESGLPLGAQLIGRAFSEELLCRLGAAYQQATDWHLREPPPLHT